MTHNSEGFQAPVPTAISAATMRAGGKPLPIIPHTLEDAFRLARAIHAGGFAPQGIDTPEKVLSVIMFGAEIGLTPMFSIQKIALINGRPSVWGDAVIAIVQASGLLEEYSETYEGEGDEFKAVAVAKRKGRSKEIVGEFSVADAKAAGLWSPDPVLKKKDRNGNAYEKANDSAWHRFPKRMLKMRARGFCLRDGFADALGGLYIREELEDAEPFEAPQPAIPAVPPPPIEVDRNPVPSAGVSQKHLEYSVLLETFRSLAAKADNTDALDDAWATLIEPALTGAPEGFHDECAAIEDKRRGELESTSEILGYVTGEPLSAETVSKYRRKLTELGFDQ